MEQTRKSDLHDIYNSFVSQLFDYSSIGGLERLLATKESLVEKLRVLLDPTPGRIETEQGGETVTRDETEEEVVTRGHYVQDLQAWLGEEALFFPDSERKNINTAAEKRRRAAWEKCRNILGWTQVRGKGGEYDRALMLKNIKQTEYLEYLIIHLVGFSLMRVDTLYRNMYYTDIYHPLLPDKVLWDIKLDVMVPLGGGSVGHAADIGSISLRNSFSDPRGTVASHDVLHGNVSIMMVAMGVQPMETSSDRQDREVLAPQARWQLKEIANVRDSKRNSNTHRPGWDEDHAGKINRDPNRCAAAVAFCFFPLPGIFEDFHTPLTPRRPKPEKLALFQTFEHICRNYEHSILHGIEQSQQEFIAEQLDVVVRRPEDSRQDMKSAILDVLAASKTTAGNPTGGLMALRTDERRLCVCVPQLESKIQPGLTGHPAVLSKLGSSATGTSKVSQFKENQLLQEFTNHLGIIDVAVPGKTHPFKIFLHGSDASVADVNIKFELEYLGKLLSDVQDCHFALRDHYMVDTNGEEPSAGHPLEGRFEESKVVTDAYEGVFHLIARVVCDEIDEQKIDSISSDIARLVFMAHRHMPPLPEKPETKETDETQSIRLPESREAGSRSLPERQKEIDETQEEFRLKVYSELMKLATCVETVKQYILGVSYYYYSPHFIAPLPGKPLFEVLDQKYAREVAGVNREWERSSIDHWPYQQYIRGLCIRASFPQEKSIPIYIDLVVDKTHCPLVLVSKTGGRLDFRMKHPEVKSGNNYIARSIWQHQPQYRRTGVALHSKNLHAYLNQKILFDTLERCPLLKSLCEVLDVKPVNLKKAAEKCPEIVPTSLFFERWPVRFYTPRGCWTRPAIKLIRRLKEFEDHIERATESALASYMKGASHGLKNALDAPGHLMHATQIELKQWLGFFEIQLTDDGEVIRPMLEDVANIDSEEMTAFMNVMAEVFRRAEIAKQNLQFLKRIAELLFWVMDPMRMMSDLGARKQKWDAAKSLREALSLAASVAVGIEWDEIQPASEAISDQERKRKLDSMKRQFLEVAYDERTSQERWPDRFTAILDVAPLDLRVEVDIPPLYLTPVDARVLESVLYELAINALKATITQKSNRMLAISCRLDADKQKCFVTLANTCRPDSRASLKRAWGNSGSYDTRATEGIHGIAQVRTLVERARKECKSTVDFNPQEDFGPREEWVEVSLSFGYSLEKGD